MSHIDTAHDAPMSHAFLAAANFYAERGQAVTPPKGNSRWGTYKVCIEHDGVPYCLDAADAHRRFSEERAVQLLNRHPLFLQRHHAEVKAVYAYCAKLGLGDIWVMEGGGAQMQAFFGNKDGYLAILYLSLESADVTDLCNTLVVNGAQNDRYFESFDIPGVVRKFHRDVFGSIQSNAG